MVNQDFQDFLAHIPVVVSHEIEDGE